MNFLRLFLASSIVFIAPWAQAQSVPVSKPAPAAPPATPTPAPALEITLVPTIQYATHDFYAHTLDHNGPAFEKASSLSIGQGVDLVVLAKNYGVSPSSDASLVYDLAITYPDGTTQQAGHDLPLCTSHVSDPKLLAYARQTARFSTEPTDPSGAYTFTVTAHDRITGATLRTTATLQITPYVEPALPADFKPLAWMASYYLHPTPALALPALFKIADGVARDNPDQWPPVLGFYEELLKDNPWLAPVFQARFDAANEADKKTLAFVLNYAWRHDSQTIAPDQKLWPDVDHGELNDPRATDILWGRFLDTGAFAPIARIVSVLHQHSSPSAPDQSDASSSAPPTAALSPAAMKELVRKSAQWSLSRNAHAQPLVRSYCEWILVQRDPDPVFNALLSDALAGTVATPSSPTPAPKPVIQPAP